MVDTLLDLVRVVLLDGGEFVQLFKLGNVLGQAHIPLLKFHEFQLLGIPNRSREILLLEYILKYVPSNDGLCTLQQPPGAKPLEFCIRL